MASQSFMTYQQGRRKRGSWGGLSLPTFSSVFINYSYIVPVTVIHLIMDPQTGIFNSMI